MLKLIVRVAQIAFFALAIAALVLLLAPKLWGERRRDLDPFRQILGERVAERAADELPRRDEIRRLLVAPVVGDLDGRMTDLLYEAVEATGKYDLVDESRVADAVRTRLGGAPPRNREEAIALARALEVEDPSVTGVLFASLPAFSPGRDGLGAEVDLEARLIALDREAEVPGGLVRATERIDGKASLAYFAGWMESRSRPLRVAVWVLLTAGLPFAIFPVVRAVTARESNRLNAVLLGSLVVANVGFGAALLGFRLGWGGVLLLVVAAVLSFVYDFVILDRIDEMRK